MQAIINMSSSNISMAVLKELQSVPLSLHVNVQAFMAVKRRHHHAAAVVPLFARSTATSVLLVQDGNNNKKNDGISANDGIIRVVPNKSQAARSLFGKACALDTSRLLSEQFAEEHRRVLERYDFDMLQEDQENVCPCESPLLDSTSVASKASTTRDNLGKEKKARAVLQAFSPYNRPQKDFHLKHRPNVNKSPSKGSRN